MSHQLSTAALPTSERGPQSAVCAAISALVRQRWGRGPSRSRAYWAGPDALLVLLDDAHTPEARGDERLSDALHEAFEQSSATRALLAQSEQAARQSLAQRDRTRAAIRRGPPEQPDPPRGG